MYRPSVFTATITLARLRASSSLKTDKDATGKKRFGMVISVSCHVPFCPPVRQYPQYTSMSLSLSLSGTTRISESSADHPVTVVCSRHKMICLSVSLPLHTLH
ncbi:uncharacterized protein PHACADRAFT_256680 [Phanerochaete carnosa HHB-10118-sp]|uniref:Uncharacterized protein n=1 Tax=Phanerochaete carnosa (strain HHB-10118-sp) TaxID=650164 RepID=K5V038_PHACS|nr:uncharacterized protein PHACADRAFT_256680 [Phanerochaete carnosa HHB-10118-sp]EKM55796.1 hypothetical protein PHACADRAFT_256680 [Phanerochaete carnosa HHB-10118-sp]